MNKRDFLNKLEELLAYELPERLVRKNIEFYSDYIDNAVAEGKSQAEVLNDLGDPQLIAKTIVDAAKSGADGIPNTEDDTDFSGEIFGTGRADDNAYGRTGSAGTGGYQGAENGYNGSSTRGPAGGFSEDPADTGEGRTFNPFGGNIHVYGHNFGCGTGVVLLLVFFLVISVIGTILGALTPILGPILLVMLLMWFFRGMGGGV